MLTKSLYELGQSCFTYYWRSAGEQLISNKLFVKLSKEEQESLIVGFSDARQGVFKDSNLEENTKMFFSLYGIKEKIDQI